MKNGTAHAVELKKAWSRHRSAVGELIIPEVPNDLTCLATGILGSSLSEHQAERAVTALLANMADFNEVRVSTPLEVQEAIGEAAPVPLERCQKLIAALQSIYDAENKLSLEKLHSLGRREARQRLEKISGVDDFAAAWVMLWYLGGHAVPVNDRLLDALRRAKLIHAEATRAEVQAFLERHISANDVKYFSMAMRTFEPSKTSKPAKRTGKKAAGDRRTKEAAK